MRKVFNFLCNVVHQVSGCLLLAIGSICALPAILFLVFVSALYGRNFFKA